MFSKIASDVSNVGPRDVDVVVESHIVKRCETAPERKAVFTASTPKTGLLGIAFTQQHINYVPDSFKQSM